MSEDSHENAVSEIAGMLMEAPETAVEQDDAAQGGEAEGLDAGLRAALAGEDLPDVEGEGEQDGEPKRAQAEAKPVESLSDAAERLGVDVAELYKLEVPMADGEAVTLGSLKDTAAAYAREAAERLEWDTEAGRQRNELAQAREELQSLYAMIPEQARTPEMLSRATEELQRARDTEARQLLQRVPEWRDQTRQVADMEHMSEHLAEYGFSADELGSVIDHRLLAYVRHNALRERRIAEALSAARGKRAVRAPRSVSGGKPKTAATGGPAGDPVAQIANLLVDKS